jgi:hypothetical protein
MALVIFLVLPTDLILLRISLVELGIYYSVAKMTNDKAQMPNQIQSSNDKSKVLDFGFEIWI